MSSKKLQESVSRVMEEEEKYVESNVNNNTMDTLFQSPATIFIKRKDSNVTCERQIVSGIIAETMKEFKGFTIQSTIGNSAHSNSKELVDAIINSEEPVDAISNSEELFDAVSNFARDPKVDNHISEGNSATDTTNITSTQKLLAKREVPAIIQGVIPPVHQTTADVVLTCVGDFHAVRTVVLDNIVMGAAPRAARVFKDPLVVNWKVEIRPIPVDMNIVGVSRIYTTHVITGTGTSTPLISKSRQTIDSPRGSIGPHKVSNTHPFKTSINKFLPNLGTLRSF